MIIRSASLLLLMPTLMMGAISYNSVGSTYSQNFNTLATSGDSHAWSNNSTLTGWYWAVSNTPPTSFYTPTIYHTSDGSGPKQGTPLSLGYNGSTDRALGGQNSNIAGQEIVYGLALLNQSDSVLREFSLSYTGEMWRAISNPEPYGYGNLQLQYQIFSSGAGSISASSGWTTVSELGYLADYAESGNVKVNGNASQFRKAISGSVSNMTWGVGQELWIRWVDNNPVPDHLNYASLSMIGIDDLSFTATNIPEPQRGVLLLVALSALVLRRNRVV